MRDFKFLVSFERVAYRSVICFSMAAIFSSLTDKSDFSFDSKLVWLSYNVLRDSDWVLRDVSRSTIFVVCSEFFFSKAEILASSAVWDSWSLAKVESCSSSVFFTRAASASRSFSSTSRFSFSIELAFSRAANSFSSSFCAAVVCSSSCLISALTD